MAENLSNKISEAARNNQVIPSVLSGLDYAAFAGFPNQPEINRAQIIQEILSGQRPITDLETYAGNIQSVGAATQPFLFSIKNLSSTYPGPAKFYEGGADNIAAHRWVFPVPPESFNVSVPGSPNIITTISGQTFSHAGNIELEEITFSGFFPSLVPAIDPNYKSNETSNTYGWPPYIPEYIKSGDPAYAKYYSPGEWVSNLVTAFRSNQPLEFCIYAPTSDALSIQSSENYMVIYPTNVSIVAFDWKMGGIGGDRRDVEFNITLKRWKQQRLGLSTYYKRPPAAQVANYTVSKGDTLIKIAQSKLGRAQRWAEIYALNKAKIDKDFKEFKKANPNTKKYLNNYPIRLGTRLRIPRR